jgi:hypothetical protein
VRTVLRLNNTKERSTRTLEIRLDKREEKLRIRRLGVRIPSRARDEPFSAFHTGRLFFLLTAKRHSDRQVLDARRKGLISHLRFKEFLLKNKVELTDWDRQSSASYIKLINSKY